MSLIVDALKAAQQERSEQAGRADAAARRRFASSALRSTATLSMPSRGPGLSAAPRSFYVSLGVFLVAIVAGTVVVVTMPNPATLSLGSRTRPASPAGAAVSPELDSPPARISVGDGLPAGLISGGGAAERSGLPSGLTALMDRAADPVDDVVGAPEGSLGGYLAAAPGLVEASVVEEPATQPAVSEPAAAPPPEPIRLTRSTDSRLEVTVGAGRDTRSALFDDAVAAQRQGDHGGAVALYRRLLETQPATAEILNNLGAALQATGDLPSARTAFERALNVQPGYAAAWSNLGVVLGALGEDDSALAALSEAIRLDPTNLGAKVNLALLYQRRGLPAEARKVLEQVLAAQPGHAEAHYALARLLDSSNESAAALRHYQLFLTHGSARFPQYEAAVRMRVQQMEAAIGR